MNYWSNASMYSFQSSPPSPANGSSFGILTGAGAGRRKSNFCLTRFSYYSSSPMLCFNTTFNAYQDMVTNGLQTDRLGPPKELTPLASAPPFNSMAVAGPTPPSARHSCNGATSQTISHKNHEQAGSAQLSGPAEYKVSMLVQCDNKSTTKPFSLCSTVYRKDFDAFKCCDFCSFDRAERTQHAG